MKDSYRRFLRTIPEKQLKDVEVSICKTILHFEDRTILTFNKNFDLVGIESKEITLRGYKISDSIFV